MKRSGQRKAFYQLALLAFLGLALNAGECRAADPFPLYPCIQPNVTFWKKIYTEFDTSQGVIHDNRDLDIIYEVIHLDCEDTAKARKTNRDRIERVRKKYEDLLKRLTADPSTRDPEARRVAELFGKGATKNDFRCATGRVRCQVGQKDRFRMGIIRSGAYVEEIRKILASYGLPEDLAYLPHVESSFNPRAYSRFGAAGVWQFTQSTGKRFMTVNYSVDERWDPIRSTHAAARLLKSNYQCLGSWPLAITAYNHGLSGMLRAKNSKGDYEAVFVGYRGRLFKFASRNFYSEFLAARDIAKATEKHFGKLELHKPIESAQIVLEGYASVTDIVRHFDVDVDTLKQLNPALREPVFRGQKHMPKGYALRLPEVSGGGLIRTTPSVPSTIYKPHQKQSVIHMVRDGDTVGGIARTHGLSADDIIMANNLDPSATIYPGQNLRIPATKMNTTTTVMVEQISEKRNLSPVFAPGEKREAEDLGESRVVFHQPKSTQEGLSSEKTKKEKSKTFGQDAVTGNLLVEKMVGGEERPIGIIRVCVNETLGHYAEWLCIQAHTIRKLNGFPNDRVVRINERIKVPLSKISKEQFEEKRFEYHKEIQEDFFASYKIEEVKIYTIKRGDNLWRLCLETFEVPFWLLNKYNPELEFNNLKPSQEILFPVLEDNV